MYICLMTNANASRIFHPGPPGVLSPVGRGWQNVQGIRCLAQTGNGGVFAGGRANFSAQLTRAVATMRMPSVIIAPIVIVRPLRPSKKKL